jgi:recombination protein RecA
MTLEDIRKDLEVINKKLGKNTLYLPDSVSAEPVETISTGSIGLDFKSGIGGFPKGKISYIVGMESCGKTTLCLHLTANAQKKGGLVAFIDGEHEYDKRYAEALGVNVSEVLIVQPDTMEEALGVLEQLAELNKFSLIILDSIAALPTDAELGAEITDAQMADKARLMGKHLRRMAPLINKIDAAIVYVNQYRESIGGYGSGKASSGGRAIKFRSALSLELAIVTTQVKIGDRAIGSRIRGKFIKNKLALPFAEWEFTIIWGKGIVEEYDLLEIAIQMDIVQKKGSWLSYNNNNIGQGIFNTAEMLRDNEELKTSIKNDVLQTLGV